MENILVLILNVARLSDCFLVIFDNFCMERTWIRESTFLYREGGYEHVERGGGAEILCVCSEGFEKSVRSRGRA